jgi:Ubiquitin fold domain
MTLAGLMQYVDENYGAELSMLSHGVTILYSNFMAKKKVDVSLSYTRIDFND